MYRSRIAPDPGTFCARRTGAWQQLMTRARIRIRKLPRREPGEGGQIAAAPPNPDHAAEHHHQSKLENQAEKRRYAVQSGEQAVTEKQPEQSGTEKPGRKTTEQARAVEKF